MAAKSETVSAIQYLRALAALAIVVVHIGWTPKLVGQQGVDIFFVISGFIMMHVSRKENRPFEFLRARAIRLVPLYWLATLAYVVLHPHFSLRDILLSLAFIPHAGANGDEPVIMQGWTLDYEAFFYVVFGLALLLPRRKTLYVLTAMLFPAALIGLFAHGSPFQIPVVTSPLLFEFLAGAWLHRLWERKILPRPWIACLCLLLAVSIIPLVSGADPYEWRFVAWGLPAFLIVAGAVSLENRLPRNRLLLLLGNASYAIYLTHWFIVPALSRILRALPGAVALPVVIGLCCLLGIAVYLLIDKPIAYLLKRYSKPAAAPQPGALNSVAPYSILQDHIVARAQERPWRGQ